MNDPGAPLIAARAVSCTFAGRRSWWRAGPPMPAVDAVTVAIQAGEVFGLVGESGSGKSTLARCLAGLRAPTAGEVWWRGENRHAWTAARWRQFRREVQLVFQDTTTSLDPRMSVGASIREPLDVHREGSRADRRARVEALLARVGLDRDLAERLPEALSGGQRQRVVLARAMALAPTLLIADEPVSSLDPSAQAQVINLLLDLREVDGLTCLLVSHDLHLVGRVCQRAAVMWRGRLVEIGPLPALFDAAAHPYTRRLVQARLTLDPWTTGATTPASVDPLPVPDDAETRRLLVAVGPDHFAAVG